MRRLRLRTHGDYTSQVTEIWDFVRSPAADAAANMALDEALLRTATERGRPLLRVYSWLRPAVSIGYFQKFPAHLVDRYEIVRRPTGGGLVYHGDGVDTTYTVVVPPEHRLYTMSTSDAYCAIHQAVAEALEDVGRVPSRGAVVVSHSPAGGSGPTTVGRSYECFERPVAGDVVANGRKLAGAAQRRTKWGLLHQGSIAARVTAERLKRGFSAILGVGFEGYKLSAAERALAGKLAREKYATGGWSRP
jgi:lipoate-protein ligase A